MANLEYFTDGNNITYYFNRFDSWQEFMSKGKVLYEAAVRKYGSEFTELGTNLPIKTDADAAARGYDMESNTIAKLDIGFYTTFIENDLLDNVILGFDEILQNIDMGGSFQKSKLIITDRPIGIFDFGLASLGLFTKVEFYSAELAIEAPSEFPAEISGIVPPIDVNLNQLEQYWYKSEVSGKSYLMTKQDKGTQAAINDGYTADSVPLKYKSFSTNQKKSYLMFKKLGGKSKKIDLYVGVGGLADMNSTGMLQRALPMFMAAEFFESVGIRTRLNATRMYEGGYQSILDPLNPKAINQMNNNPINSNVVNCSTVVIKDFGEPLDFTKLAIAVADERTFRYNLWKYLPAINAMNSGVSLLGYGTTVYSGGKMFETGQRYKNWYIDQVQNNDKEWGLIEKPLMIFGGVPYPEDSWTYTGDKNESGYANVLQEFYRILDIVDFTYNKPDKAAARVYERLVTLGGETITEFKDYIFKTLGQAYGVVEDGEFNDTPTEVSETITKFNDKIDGFNEFLATK